jgi:hypothetical protein
MVRFCLAAILEQEKNSVTFSYRDGKPKFRHDYAFHPLTLMLSLRENCSTMQKRERVEGFRYGSGIRPKA